MVENTLATPRSPTMIGRGGGRRPSMCRQLSRGPTSPLPLLSSPMSNIAYRWRNSCWYAPDQPEYKGGAQRVVVVDDA